MYLGISIMKNNLLATLPSWGPTYKVSFDLYIRSFDAENLGGGVWAELIRFTSTNNHGGSPGDRVPAVFTHKNLSIIHVVNQIGSNVNYATNVKLSEKTWYKVELVQYPYIKKVRGVNSQRNYSKNIFLSIFMK